MSKPATTATSDSANKLAAVLGPMIDSIKVELTKHTATLTSKIEHSASTNTTSQEELMIKLTEIEKRLSVIEGLVSNTAVKPKPAPKQKKTEVSDVQVAAIGAGKPAAVPANRMIFFKKEYTSNAEFRNFFLSHNDIVEQAKKDVATKSAGKNLPADKLITMEAVSMWALLKTAMDSKTQRGDEIKNYIDTKFNALKSPVKSTIFESAEPITPPSDD